MSPSRPDARAAVVRASLPCRHGLTAPPPPATARGRQARAPSVPRRPGTPVPATARRSAAGRRTSRSARARSASVSRCAPPMHSVTSWPVISTCTPPAQVPSAAWTSKKPRTSRQDGVEVAGLDASPAVVIVLPCIGSHSHTTLVALALAPRAPAAAAARRPCRRPCG